MSYVARLEEFWPLLPEWEQLVRRHGHAPFANPIWHWLWCQEFGGERALSFVALRRDDDLVGVAPLLWENGSLSLIGGEDLWDYQDLVTAPGLERAGYEALLEALEPWPWSTLTLPAVPESSPTRSLFLPVALERGHTVAEQEIEVCPQVPLPATWEAYLEGLGKKDRHELRRKFRRLEVAGAVRFVRVEGPQVEEQAVEEFLRLYRLTPRRDKAEFLTDQRARFFATMLRELYPHGLVRLFFLELEGLAVASTLCFDTGEAYLLYNSGYDPSYAASSVGLLLKALCIRDAIERGRRCFDFLRGSEPYKYDLGGRNVALYRCTVTRLGRA